jgi:glycosyltransferase involved in cell wall biosynthesis
MHVAIDTTPIETGHGLRGVGVYTKLLIGSLQQYESNHSYSFFTRTQKVDKNADIIHYPYFDPFFLTLPLLKEKPTVVTVHDLIPLVFPDKFPAGIKGNMRLFLQKAALQSVRRIITDSHTSKKDIARLTGYPDDRIDAVYLAPTLGKESQEELASKKFTVPKKYVLYVGDVNWNKNIHGLLEAFARLAEKHSELLLVLVGKSFVDENLIETKRINAHIDRLTLTSRIIRPGYVSDGQLKTLYEQAMCLVQPSYYEGFGLPVLDAMMWGCPVVVSNVSSLEEIAGPSLRVHPDDIKSIAAAVMKLEAMTSHSRKKLIQDGYDWASKFSWQRVAHETLATYKKAI